PGPAGTGAGARAPRRDRPAPTRRWGRVRCTLRIRSRGLVDRPKKPPEARGLRGLAVGSTRALEEALELSTPHRVLELPHGLGLDLANPLAGHLEDPAHLLEGVGIAVPQPVAELDDLALAVGQGLEHLVDLLLGHLRGGRVDRALGGLILDEIAEVAVLALAHGPVERDRVAGDLHHPPGLLDRDIRRPRGLLDRRLPAFLLEQLLGDV